jgi:hypothetical protein
VQLGDEEPYDMPRTALGVQDGTPISSGEARGQRYSPVSLVGDGEPNLRRRRLSFEMKLRAPPNSFTHYPALTLSTPPVRTQIAYVPQRPFLFALTIAENILNGLQDPFPLRN